MSSGVLPHSSAHFPQALALVLLNILCFCFLRNIVPSAVISGLSPHLQLWLIPELQFHIHNCLLDMLPMWPFVTSNPRENRDWTRWSLGFFLVLKLSFSKSAFKIISIFSLFSTSLSISTYMSISIPNFYLQLPAQHVHSESSKQFTKLDSPSSLSDLPAFSPYSTSCISFIRNRHHHPPAWTN